MGFHVDGGMKRRIVILLTGYSEVKEEGNGQDAISISRKTDSRLYSQMTNDIGYLFVQ